MRIPLTRTGIIGFAMGAFVCCISTAQELGGPKAKRFVQFGEHFFESIKTKPTVHKIKKIENTHVEGQIDEWHTLQFDGYWLTYYRVVPEKRNILSKLIIDSKNIQMPFKINIGVAKASIFKSLGNPTSTTPNEISYECGDPYSQTVTFLFKNGILHKVTWENEIE